MTASPVSYSDVIAKQRVEAWAEGLDFDPEEQIFTLLENKFNVSEIIIVDVRPEGDTIILTICTNIWAEPQEFALFRSGSLAW